ncbi:MAG: exodeoxyribonuclease VII large subunit [Clostridia bacterium]|nr:exodeoxyribonuclease VII large subunit [Clostridia bacterium]
MEEWVLSVGQLNEYVRRSLAADPMLKRVKLRGEISNFKRHTSGHLYFSLKDEEARIACVMFRSSADDLRLRPMDGLRVVLGGQVGLYARDGQYQFYADTMREDGVGQLYLRFEALKRKLEAEGLFDAARKRPLPLLPRTIGVVTSPTGAAVRDIVHVATRRNPQACLLLYPAQVQGEGAAGEIAQGIQTLGAIPEVDVLIVGRGGGSMEELWAFNEEIVARAIAACPVPVVSAVGHETDFTIADFVSDLRAATPSAAAEHVVQEIEGLLYGLETQQRRLRIAAQQRLFAASARLERLQSRLQNRHPARALQGEKQRLQHIKQRFGWLAEGELQAMAARLGSLGERLRALSPSATLARGFAYVIADGVPILSARTLQVGQRFSVQMRDGRIDATAEAVHTDKKGE